MAHLEALLLDLIQLDVLSTLIMIPYNWNARVHLKLFDSF